MRLLTMLPKQVGQPADIGKELQTIRANLATAD
jgi:hypothetical protein